MIDYSGNQIGTLPLNLLKLVSDQIFWGILIIYDTVCVDMFELPLVLANIW